MYYLIDKDTFPEFFWQVFSISSTYKNYWQSRNLEPFDSKSVYPEMSDTVLVQRALLSLLLRVSFVLRLQAKAHQGLGFSFIQEFTILQMQRLCTKEWQSSISCRGKVLFPSAWSSLETGLASTPVTLEGFCRSPLSPESMGLHCFFWSCVLKNHWALTRKWF